MGGIESWTIIQGRHESKLQALEMACLYTQVDGVTREGQRKMCVCVCACVCVSVCVCVCVCMCVCMLLYCVMSLTYSNECDGLEGHVEWQDQDQHDEDGIQVELPDDISTPEGEGQEGGGGERE